MLASYITQTRQLIRDGSQSLYPGPDPNATLTQYINEARVSAASDTGCTRVQLTTVSPAPVGKTTATGISMVAGQLWYPLASVKVAGAVYTILDVMGVAVTIAGIYYPLGYMEWSEMQRSGLLTYVGYQDYPRAFTVMGQQVGIAPLPLSTSPQTLVDWDVVPYVASLTVDADPEPIPQQFQLPIPFYAAFKCFLEMQQTARAKEMFMFYINQTQFSSRRQFQRRLKSGGVY